MQPPYDPKSTPSQYNANRIAAGAHDSPTWEQLREAVLLHRYENDLGADLSTAKKALLRSIVTLQVWCEVQTYAMHELGGLHSDFAKNTNALLRLLKELGLERAQRDVTPPAPTFDQIAARAAQARAEAETVEVCR